MANAGPAADVDRTVYMQPTPPATRPGASPILERQSVPAQDPFSPQKQLMQAAAVAAQPAQAHEDAGRSAASTYPILAADVPSLPGTAHPPACSRASHESLAPAASPAAAEQSPPAAAVAVADTGSSRDLPADAQLLHSSDQPSHRQHMPAHPKPLATLPAVVEVPTTEAVEPATMPAAEGEVGELPSWQERTVVKVAELDWHRGCRHLRHPPFDVVLVADVVNSTPAPFLPSPSPRPALHVPFFWQ